MVGGVTLRSESDSDTGLRGREAEEVGRDVDQVGTTGEDRGFGSVDTPDRDLEKSSKATSQHLPSNLEVVLENIHMENILFTPHRLFPHNWISWSVSAQQIPIRDLYDERFTVCFGTDLYLLE